ncbi:hypothetical protein LCGC14_1546190 [marine sediment metagenome]|uniref:Uncharacterized protein n=1 Tax=marine sediment metagenome TaxID=412755 RepID=A0A0F9JCI1_9ZZZZ
MKSKVLSGIVIAVFFLSLHGLAISSLPQMSELSGFWEYLSVIVAFLFIAGSVYVGAIITIKWWVK